MYEFELKEKIYYEDEYNQITGGIYVDYPWMFKIIKNNQNIKYDYNIFSYTNKERFKYMKCFNNDYNPLISYEFNINDKFGEND